jgi:hypothetical protein
LKSLEFIDQLNDNQIFNVSSLYISHLISTAEGIFASSDLMDDLCEVDWERISGEVTVVSFCVCL